MASFVIERHGYNDATTLIKALATDMTANGFTLISPNSITGSEVAPFRIIMEAGPTVDPIAANQPWRICLDVIDIQTCFVYVGTPNTLQNDGNIAYDIQVIQPLAIPYLGPVDVLGSCGAQIGNNPQDLGMAFINRTTGILGWTRSSFPGIEQIDDVDVGFINRGRRIGTASGAGHVGANQGFPMSYRLVISPRGIWIGMWEDAVSNTTANYFNWILVQRPVDRNTGAVVTTGKAPVFCVNAAGTKIWQFVVRESDTMRPAYRRSATVDSADSEGILNVENQVGLSEDGKYVVTFPSRLNTARYRYPHELDMIATTSADVVSQYSDVPLEVYGESQARTYKAMMSSGKNNTGMRLLVLQQGGGVGS